MVVNKSVTEKKIQQRKKNERGASLVEYALLVALIAVVCILTITTIGNNANARLGEAAAALAN
jgi:pilus assembly protein Flp/PilA